MRSKLLITLTLLALVSFSTLASAQEVFGNIAGTVTDSSGATVPNAKITVTNTTTGTVIRTITSNADGGYTAPSLPLGKYSLTVEAPGFSKTIVSNIEVNVNDRLTINPSLKVGGSNEVMTVEAEPLQVELQAATSSTLISGEQIRELSLNNRNYIQLVSLMPGVSYGGSDQIYIGTTNPDGQTNVISFSINGQRTSQNNWTIDGADNVDRGSNLTLLNYPSVDAIAEFKVLRGQYTAEFGRTSAGHVNVVTKSGTKSFHGGAYEFVRNDIFNANTYLNNARNLPRPRQRYNNFGYTIGGPVIIPGLYNPAEKKTFFFFSQEFRRVQRQATLSGLAPTAAERAGTFTKTVCTAANTYTTTCPAGSTGTTVAAINPIAQQYLSAIWANIPTPSDAGLHQIFTPVSSTFNHRQELAKIDHVFGPRWQISGRYLHDDIPTVEPGGLFTGAVLPGVSNTSTNSPGRTWVFRSVNSFTPTLLMEVGYANSYGAIISRLAGTASSAASPGINPILAFPKTLARIPAVSYTNGPSTITGFGPYDDFNRNHNVFVNMTKSLQKHTLKWGGNYFHYQKTENAGGNNTGTFNFNSNGAVVPTVADPGYTLAQTQANARFQQAWANFLVGDVNSFTQASLDITPDLNTNQMEFYFQDDWKVRPNLTLNIGLRYSMFREVHDENGVLTNFVPSRYDPARAPLIGNTGQSGNIISAAGTYDPLNGLILGGSTSPWGDKVGREANNNWAPRFGFAWDPYGKGKTAIRGGYGVSYDFYLVGIYEQNSFTNPPVVDNITISNTRFENALASAPTVSAAVRSLRATPTVGKTPSVQSWSLDFQHELPGGVIAAIGYYGNVGRHQIGILDLNQPTPGQLTIINGLPDSASTAPHVNQIRPYKGFGPIGAIMPIFTSNYNGMQMSAQKRWKGASQVSVSYTWSKGLTTAQTDRSSAPQNTYNLGADYGPSQLDRKHIFTANYVWELPWMKEQNGVVGHILGGWQASGIINAYSGLPLTIITSGLDPAGQAIPPGAASARPDLIGDPNGPKGTDFQSGPLWFNTAAFQDVCPASLVPGKTVQVTATTFRCLNSRPGNSPRGVVRGPGFNRIDFSIFKNIKIYESVRLQFRTEVFNILNHTNPNGVSTTMGTSTFGRITSYRDPREMQFGLKLNF